jgi:Ca2+:H+ antiporter
MGTLFHRNYNSTTSDPPSQDVDLTLSGSPAKPATIHPAQEKGTVLPIHQVNHNGHRVTKHIAPEVRQTPMLPNQPNH